MEHATCNVIYVDRRVRQDRCIRCPAGDEPEDEEWESEHIAENARLLSEVFGEIHLCSTGGACLTQWLNLQDTSMLDLKPTLILIDTPFDDRASRSRTREPSPHSPPEDSDDQEDELYGLNLLRRIVSESYLRNFAAKLVVPVPLVVFPNTDCPEPLVDSSDAEGVVGNRALVVKNKRTATRRMLKKCLDLGATDVMSSPMNSKCITNLEVHAYRAHREAARDQQAVLEVRRGRKRSWVGISEEKPFAYLREAMVSNLMNGICRVDLGVDDAVSSIRISVPAEKQGRITDAIGKWYFCAHDFSDDELVFAAAAMFKHAFSMPELEQWRIPTDQLHSFLIATRAAYNEFVPYHNFRHVVDVLQATFHFLVQIGVLPPTSHHAHGLGTPSKSPMALILSPFEALTLLITAIGHDVGHPGVNNGFLVVLNAPLAQLYNDRSVLESFHCAAYSQILRRYWPSAFIGPKMRNLMISSILATDMGLHHDYMKKMGDLQDKLSRNNSTEGWNARMIDEQKALACALLIKCADISNVARRYGTAVQWMHILSDEFSRQASIEDELEIPSSLVSPPKKDVISLARSQLGFMNMFAIPLFQGVADILPKMQYCVDELEVNKALFEQSIVDEQSKEPSVERLLHRDGTFSPRTMSMAATPEQGRNTPSTTKEYVPSPMITENGSSIEKDSIIRVTDHSDLSAEYKINGIVTTFDSVADFARSDPFQLEGNMQGPTKQRCSETTEGSSAPYPPDCASQATSATTGKMPLSPSTQGTSIISRESLERPTSVPVTMTTAPDSTTTVPDSMPSQPESRVDRDFLTEDDAANGFSKGKMRGTEVETERIPTLLKKKSSRFRINALGLFSRKHKTASPPQPATNTAG